MTKRIKQHELEDLSRAKFQLLIPREWVYRDKDKDYGIDGEVELFDEKGDAEGILFFVQLKATESEDQDIAHSITLKIDRIRYYKTLDVPVLIVRYADKEGSFFIKWAHDIDLFFVKKGAKTHKVVFDESDRWKDNTPTKINATLKKIRKAKSGYFTFPISLTLNIAAPEIRGHTKAILTLRLRAALKNYSTVVTVIDSEDEALAHAVLTPEYLSVQFGEISGCFIHSIDKKNEERFIDDIAADVLIGLSVSFIRFGYFDHCGRIIFESNVQDKLIGRSDLLTRLLPVFLRGSYFKQGLDMAGRILDGAKPDTVDLAVHAAIILGDDALSEQKLKLVEEFLISRLQSASNHADNINIAVAHYNLAGHYRGRRLLRRAAHHFIMAKKNSDIYLRQHYFYSELAGVLFLMERYRIAAKLYKKAQELGAGEAIEPLYADAMLFAGHYSQSLDLFNKYLENSSSDHDEWYLKVLCVENLMNEIGIKDQARKEKDALKKADIKYNLGGDNVEYLKNVLREDMLCGLALFNLGVEYSRSHNYEKAADCFTLCGLVQTWDIQAWVNASICAMHKSDVGKMVFFVIRAAYYYNGDNFLEALYKEIGTQSNKSFVEELSIAIEQIIPKKTGKGLKIIRLLDADGYFKNIMRDKQE